MSKSRRGMIFLGGAVVVAGALYAARGGIVPLIQTVESDGIRSKEYKVFGLIPIGTLSEKVPDLKVTDDVLANLDRTIQSPGSVDLRASTMTLRIYRRTGHDEYSVRMPFAGKSAAVLGYYEKQLTTARHLTSRSTEIVSGTAKDGSLVSATIIDSVPAAGPRTRELTLKVTRR